MRSQALAHCCLPAILAPRSWQAARTAVRFAGTAALADHDGRHGEPAAFSPVVRWDDLGSRADLAERLDPATLVQVDDVAALDRLAACPAKADALALLCALCLTGSVRQAATARPGPQNGPFRFEGLLISL